MAGNSRWTHFLVHHSAGLDTDAIETARYEAFHRRVRGWSDIGYHWVVESVAGIYLAVMARPMTRSGSHAGRDWNGRGLGICFAGNFEHHVMPDLQVREGAQLIAGLGLSLGIPDDVDRIIPHHQVRATVCPGRHFPLAKLRHYVTDYRAGALPAGPVWRGDLADVRLG